jgi:hypothetical protein
MRPVLTGATHRAICQHAIVIVAIVIIRRTEGQMSLKKVMVLAFARET